MWPFKSEKQRQIEQFGRFISPEAMEEILKNPDADYPTRRSVSIGLMIIWVRDESIEVLDERLSDIIYAIQQNEGTMDHIMLPLVIAHFGFPGPIEVNPAHACKAANKFIETFGTQIKIVYGYGEALIGSWGNENYAMYGPGFPLLSKRLEMLCKMDYGDLHEMNF